MFNNLGLLIDYIEEYYKNINDQWKNEQEYAKINLKNKTIIDLQKNREIYNVVASYRDFISLYTFDFDPDFIMNDGVKINSRTKAYNSMIYKIDRESKGFLKGKVPINKRLNDLYGVRFIYDGPVHHDEVETFVKLNYSHLKCINSSKNGYIGTHIYFSEDNFTFPWELQVWSTENEQSNYDSHIIYKQDYLSWEEDCKGGV